MVFNFCLNYTQQKEDAEEITQDVFLSIHQSLHKFKEESSYKTWIYRITLNKCIDFQKSKKRTKRFAQLLSIFKPDSVEIQYDNVEINHPGVQLEDKEALQKVFFALNSLKETQKTAIILHKMENKSQKEIAEIMGISPKAVESLIQRAKNNLSEMLKKTKD